DDRLIKDESGKPFWFPKPAGESYKTELLSEDDKKQAAALKKISKSPYAKRTAEEILEHGLLAGTGCTDYTTVFVSLCRHSGIPVKHVLTVSADWLNLPNDDKQDPHTHSFTRVYDKETSKWKLYDPKWWKNPNYRDFYSGRDEGGLDSHVHADGEKFVYYGEDDNLWGMGMRSSKELREVLQGFRREYKAQRKE
ncbi:MAG: transglutaminase domain-containing protein, partial [Candidatus Altiarchaeales archaeon]|nr:transglutaminase domain-containing protein [Candidatus Altiarchaeales archaeon]